MLLAYHDSTKYKNNQIINAKNIISTTTKYLNQKLKTHKSRSPPKYSKSKKLKSFIEAYFRRKMNATKVHTYELKFSALEKKLIAFSTKTQFVQKVII